MNEFGLWFGTGVEHILDLEGYDHILFVTLMVLASGLKDWRRLLQLITAFTVGHSISLALSATNLVQFSSAWVEFLIALTILLSALFQVVRYKQEEHGKNFYLYLIIITLFGLVHGLGFSILLKSMLGHEQSIILPLLYFNLGLELGQIIIVVIVLVFSFLISVFKWPFKIYKLIVVCIIGTIALKISAERLSDLFQSW